VDNQNVSVTHVKDDLTDKQTNNHLLPIVAIVFSIIAIGLHFVNKKPANLQ
jgi:hypothetical protein